MGEAQVAIEGLDATMLIESGGFVPEARISDGNEWDGGPTLDDALREIGRAGRAPGARRAGGEAADERAALDL